MPPTIEDFRIRLANTVIGGSVLRNVGAPGVVKAARTFIRSMDPALFVLPTVTEFLDHLDGQTEALKSSLPEGGRSFGAARKAINLFLGEAYYHQFVCKEYGLERIAHWLEVPLDSQVAAFLNHVARQQALSSLPPLGVKRLSEDDNRRYQDFAMVVAEGLGPGWYRIHLDLIAWGRKSG